MGAPERLVDLLSEVVQAFASAEAGSGLLGAAAALCRGVGDVLDEVVGARDKKPWAEDDPQANNYPLRQQEQQKQHIELGSGRSVTCAGGAHRPRAPHTALTAPFIVLTSPELLVHIMGFVGGGHGKLRGRANALGAAALVCCTWRDAAQHERLWAPLVKELFPRLAAGDQGMTMAKVSLQNRGRSYRKYLVECGRMSLGRRVLTCSWHRGLALEFDLWDFWSRCSIFSAEGVVVTNVGDGSVMMSVDGLGSSFLPASRTGGHELCNSMVEYLGGLVVGVRITVHDTHTGQKAVLWNSNHVGSVIYEDVADVYLVSSVDMPMSTVSFGPALETAVEFRVEADTDAKELDSTLPDTQKMWRVTRATLSFKTNRILNVGRLVWSALGY